MNVAAIYARKSTEQTDAQSVTRQVELARAFAVQKGWTVDEQFIFVDDGISGAETLKLVQKQRMLASLGEFQVLVMQAADRFSRRDDGFAELTRVAKAGVQIWFYADSRQFEHKTMVGRVDGFLRGEFATEFRRIIVEKTTEAMLFRATHGFVTGGKVFGYDNVPSNGYVDRQINKAEAAIVKDIYKRYADGEGFKAIAHALNAKKLPSPRPQRGRPQGWEPSTVRSVLRRSVYRGTVIYNKTKKLDPDDRHKGQPKKSESEWITVAKPELRIVSENMAEAVDERLESRRQRYLHSTGGKRRGRPKGSAEGKHLLAGFIVCDCGSTFEATRGYYRCSARRRKGPNVCPGTFAFPVAAIDGTFLDAIEHTVLSQTFIDRILDGAFASNPDAERDGLLAERQRLTTEMANLTKGIAAGGEIPALVKALTERDRQLNVVDTKLEKPVVMPDRETLRAALELRKGQWRDTLRGPHIAQARLVLQHLVELPIRILNKKPPAYLENIKPGDVRGTENIGVNDTEPGTRGIWATHTRPGGGLLVGLIHKLASPMPASWNRIVPWLQQIDELRRAA